MAHGDAVSTDGSGFGGFNPWGKKGPSQEEYQRGLDKMLDEHEQRIRQRGAEYDMPTSMPTCTTPQTAPKPQTTAAPPCEDLIDFLDEKETSPGMAVSDNVPKKTHKPSPPRLTRRKERPCGEGGTMEGGIMEGSVVVENKESPPSPAVSPTGVQCCGHRGRCRCKSAESLNFPPCHDQKPPGPPPAPRPPGPAKKDPFEGATFNPWTSME